MKLQSVFDGMSRSGSTCRGWPDISAHVTTADKWNVNRQKKYIKYKYLHYCYFLVIRMRSRSFSRAGHGVPKHTAPWWAYTATYITAAWHRVPPGTRGPDKQYTKECSHEHRDHGRFSISSVTSSRYPLLGYLFHLYTRHPPHSISSSSLTQ